MKLSFALFFTAAAAILTSYAQSQTPVVIQALTPAQQAAPRAVAAAPAVDTSTSVVKALQDMKAANKQILQKQAAALQQLEEMEKAAEQIKIYSKRG